MKTLKGLYIPDHEKHHIQNKCCHSAIMMGVVEIYNDDLLVVGLTPVKDANDCDRIICEDCIFASHNSKTFLDWSIINRREEKLERILNGTV